MEEATKTYEELRQRAYTLFEKGKNREAIKVWADVLQMCHDRLGPTLQVLYWVAEAHFRLGEFEDANRIYRKILKAKKENGYVIQRDLLERCESAKKALRAKAK